MSRPAASALVALLAGAVAGAGSEEACPADAPPGTCSPGSASRASRASRASKDSLLLQTKRASVNSSPEEGWVNFTHEQVGCFPRSAGDVDDEIVFEDRRCLNLDNATRDGDGPCRSGLPFYRFYLHKEESFLDCFTFCLSKGLDLCGVVYSELASADECRCGATPLNKGVWGSKSPDPRLLLSESPVPQDDERCKVVVWKYTGGFTDGEVPTPLVHMSASDEAYTEGIAFQVDPDTISDEGLPASVEGASPSLGNSSQEPEVSLVQGLCKDNNAAVAQYGGCQQLDGHCSEAVKRVCPVSCGVCEAGGYMSCYPDACGPGGGPWPKTGNIVYVNYYFHPTLDQERQTKFAYAISEWERNTCVIFRRSQTRPTIKVWQDPQRSGMCQGSIGFPGPSGEAFINWGNCLKVPKWGTAAHELGHVLGMNHEHKRPDGTQSFYTPDGWKGPYMTVLWSHVNEFWKKQFVPAEASYIGSPKKGYVGYDYESIMHYPKTSYFYPRRPEYNNVIGSRSGLSTGDKDQFKDMYDC